MKKQIIISMLVLLLVGTLIAQIVLTRNIDITLNKNTKDKLAEYNITNPQTSELICDSSICKFRMYDGSYNLGTHTFERGDMTQQQLLDKQDEIIDEFLRDYANVLLERENREVKTKVGNEGVVTIR